MILDNILANVKSATSSINLGIKQPLSNYTKSKGIRSEYSDYYAFDVKSGSTLTFTSSMPYSAKGCTCFLGDNVSVVFPSYSGELLVLDQFGNSEIYPMSGQTVVFNRGIYTFIYLSGTYVRK